MLYEHNISTISEKLRNKFEVLLRLIKMMVEHTIAGATKLGLGARPRLDTTPTGPPQTTTTTTAATKTRIAGKKKFEKKFETNKSKKNLFFKVVEDALGCLMG